VSEAKTVTEAIKHEVPDSKSAPCSSHCYPAIPVDALRYRSADEAVAACDEWDSPIHSIRHVIRVGPSEWAIMGHINCEDCEFCHRGIPANTRHCVNIIQAG